MKYDFAFLFLGSFPPHPLQKKAKPEKCEKPQYVSKTDLKI
jgi:hypothetical protein